jgi:hypothetical protein
MFFILTERCKKSLNDCWGVDCYMFKALQMLIMLVSVLSIEWWCEAMDPETCSFRAVSVYEFVYFLIMEFFSIYHVIFLVNNQKKSFSSYFLKKSSKRSPLNGSTNKWVWPNIVLTFDVLCIVFYHINSVATPGHIPIEWLCEVLDAWFAHMDCILLPATWSRVFCNAPLYFL